MSIYLYWNYWPLYFWGRTACKLQINSTWINLVTRMSFTNKFMIISYEGFLEIKEFKWKNILMNKLTKHYEHFPKPTREWWTLFSFSRLSDCNITEKGYTALTKALKSNRSSHLINLDLRGNDPGDSGMTEIRSLMNDTECKLTLRWALSPSTCKIQP